MLGVTCRCLVGIPTQDEINATIWRRYFYAVDGATLGNESCCGICEAAITPVCSMRDADDFTAICSSQRPMSELCTVNNRVIGEPHSEYDSEPSMYRFRRFKTP